MSANVVAMMWIGILIAAWLIAAWLLIRSRKREADWRKYAYIPQATIAHDIGPRLKGFLEDQDAGDCEMIIVGSDGHTLEDEDYPWGAYLADWTGEGHRCRVVLYLSMDVARDVEGRLDGIAEKSNGRFEWRRFARPDQVSDPDDRTLLSRFGTFHPTLCWNRQTGEGVMWIEHCHPPASKAAYNCHFFPPAKAVENGFDFYKERIEYAWKLTQGFGEGGRESPQRH